MEFGLYQFGEVHVSQNSHDDRGLGLAHAHSLLCTQRPQHRQNVTQSKVIMHLQ